MIILDYRYSNYDFQEVKVYEELIGLKGGHDATYWEVIDVSAPFSDKYWPAIVDGEEKPWSEFPDFDSYLAAKQERRRVTVRLTILGNPVAAEETIAAKTGKRCLATTPNSLDVYLVADDPDAG